MGAFCSNHENDQEKKSGFSTFTMILSGFYLAAVLGVLLVQFAVLPDFERMFHEMKVPLSGLTMWCLEGNLIYFVIALLAVCIAKDFVVKKRGAILAMNVFLTIVLVCLPGFIAMCLYLPLVGIVHELAQ